jgi:anti-anti-sigma regulatory factor
VVGCGRLLGKMQKARKARREIVLLGGDSVGKLLESRIQTGCAEEGDCWLLLLELYQSQGQQERFEDLAIDYAVTFEISPPSWEAARVAIPEVAPTLAITPEENEASMSEAYVARGDIKASRFNDLAAFIEVHDPVIIDCLNLSRIDFISAGALLNLLSSARRAGKHIVFRHPNHLVAELFGVLGLKAVADIVPANI